MFHLAGGLITTSFYILFYYNRLILTIAPFYTMLYYDELFPCSCMFWKFILEEVACYECNRFFMTWSWIKMMSWMTLLESRKPNDLLFPANHFSYHSLLDLESNNSSFPLTLANFLPYLLLDQIQIACSGVLFFFPLGVNRNPFWVGGSYKRFVNGNTNFDRAQIQATRWQWYWAKQVHCSSHRGDS